MSHQRNTDSTADSGAAGRAADERITAYGLLLEANRRLERVFEQSLRANHNMTKVTFEALLRLGRSDGGQMSMSELADQMVLSSGGVTRLIDRLAADGHVERIQCAEDRRVQWAHLTDAGRRQLESALESHLSDLEIHFSSMIDPGELNGFMTVLDRIRCQCRSVADGTPAQH